MNEQKLCTWCLLYGHRASHCPDLNRNGSPQAIASLSDLWAVVGCNLTYFVEQMEAMPVGVYHYKVAFKPQSILPNIDFKGSVSGG